MNAMKKLPLKHRFATTDKRRGTATVEFAVVAPLFVVLALGTWEMGTAVTASNNLTAAIREGGRLASMDYTGMLAVNQNANQKVIQDVKAFLSAAGIPGASVTVTITHADGPSAGSTFNLQDNSNYLKLFRITATVPYSAVSLFPSNFLGGKTLRAELICRRGRVASTN